MDYSLLVSEDIGTGQHEEVGKNLFALRHIPGVDGKGRLQPHTPEGSSISAATFSLPKSQWKSSLKADEVTCGAESLDYALAENEIKRRELEKTTGEVRTVSCNAHTELRKVKQPKNSHTKKCTTPIKDIAHKPCSLFTGVVKILPHSPHAIAPFYMFVRTHGATPLSPAQIINNLLPWYCHHGCILYYTHTTERTKSCRIPLAADVSRRIRHSSHSCRDLFCCNLG